MENRLYVMWMALVSWKIPISTMMIVQRFWGTWFCENLRQRCTFLGRSHFSWTTLQLCPRHSGKWWSCDALWQLFGTAIVRRSKKWKLKFDIQSECSIQMTLYVLLNELSWTFLQIFRNLWEIRWLQEWTREAKATKATAGDIGYCSFPSIRNPNEIRWSRSWRKTGKIGTAEERFGNVCEFSFIS